MTVDRHWHQHAVIYQLHVRTFCDSNGDGVGDFPGLIQRLPYLQQLGVTCLWLLPFYESPLRDDGYDIAHYERIHPHYGTMADVERLIDEAHRRGMRLITELVINHTSDQHPWFQAARHAPAGSHKRDFYVWSDTPDRYAQARIIFSDAETSNWTWDPVAGAYYWHRFFRHQPDLNFENPHVRQAVLKVMRFWFDKGIDGLRLDAIAHLYEREGTSCDNLPETHALLKHFREDVNARYGDRILLAEASQPPALLREYFGDGDECHMAFHFPLVPRLFAAFERGDAAPIVQIVNETGGLPAGCQWALFLRNHDDLSLSALGATENDRLLDVYAPDPAMRLHGGIRRRLSSLLGHDRRRIEMAYALLLSLPGSPIVYYGDEIGMGDDVALPDRDGLRTPMQWDGSAHGGFTKHHVPTIPAIAGPPAGFPHVNVQAQLQDETSLLRRLAVLIHCRQACGLFGSGTITFIEGVPRGVLCFLRHVDAGRVLVAVNLTGAPVAVPIALAGARPASTLRSLLDHSEVASAEGQSLLELRAFGYGWWDIRDEPLQASSTESNVD